MVRALTNALQPPTQQEPLTDTQVQNNAGGYVWQITPWQQLRRFLVLGTEGGTFYQTERDLTKQNLATLDACIRENGIRVVSEAVDVSDHALAPKNDYAIFALARVAAIGTAEERQHAYANLNNICRTGTHLFQFAAYSDAMRGWGRGLRAAVADWYGSRTVEQVAYQAVKYQQRGGWSHRDLLRLAHPKTNDGLRNAIYRWITVGVDGVVDGDTNTLPDIIVGFERIKAASNAKEAAALIREHKLPREAVPTQFLTSPEVWEALLDVDMPYIAMLRNLANMTRAGVIAPLSDNAWRVGTALQDPQAIRKSRVHPLQILVGMRTYAAGHGARGSNTWEPTSQIVDALDSAFYTAFKNVEPTGKSVLLALDISGSMGSASPLPGLTARDVSAAMALVTAATEPRHAFVGFTHELRPLDISPRMRLDDVIRKVSGLPFGATDCAQPFIHALKHRMDVDVFGVYTDNETWAGRTHPASALKEYRLKRNPLAKSYVMGITATNFSIADPHDAGMLDLVGFDASAPALISAFMRGDL